MNITALVADAVSQALQMAASVKHSGPGPGDWEIIGDGHPITHCIRGKGRPDRMVAVKSKRATWIDRSRYPGHVLREIRKTTHNAKGEMRR